jgi:uncharacterized protein (TIGR00290 family)
VADALALSWSGGKDSALALWALRKQGREPCALFTTLSEASNRVSHHGVRRELLARQADEAGVELVEVLIPSACSKAEYEHRLERAFAETILSQISTFAFGDIYLTELRSRRERKLEAIGRTALFPLWQRHTGELAGEFIAAGFEATIVSIHPQTLDQSFLGRPFNHDLLADLPDGVDPCGENGEFHTFVHAGSIFANPIPITRGAVIEQEGLVFRDLSLSSSFVPG